ncbi:MAG TPA: NAD(P)/FAD-dependent oxidoreductase [Vicinamibacteria bacterium]|nr:NAD(P)/FAD-dependent oxidoreductase [Vicinamibacteria bacterium]
MRADLPSATDVVVVGAGFGGLATALRLSELGARVVLCEALDYPGGCASTFSRGGCRFESGATLFSGFGRGQLFDRWVERYGIDTTIDWLDPVVELRTPSIRIPVSRRRERFVASLASLPGAPRESIYGFFDRQRRVADLLWSLVDEPDLMPPFGLSAAWRHALRARDYLSLLPLLGISLQSVLRRHLVSGFSPLRIYLEALCQITVQCPPEEAEALLALGAMDYYFRGTGHVRGGIGKLAEGLADAIRSLGGAVSMANHVTNLKRANGRWLVSTRRGDIESGIVVANVLPHGLRELTGRSGDELKAADDLARRVESGWGACMLYRVARRPAGVPVGPHHLQLIRDPSVPFVEGNHVFCSFSGELDGDRAPEGYGTCTVSTHVPVSKLARMSLREQRAYVETVHASMRETLERLAPEWEEAVLEEMTASPRTFQRFTKRFLGYVGGIPRRVGLAHYRALAPRPLLSGLYLVGDTVFPGQSTLATAIGGYKLADHIARRT